MSPKTAKKEARAKAEAEAKRLAKRRRRRRLVRRVSVVAILIVVGSLSAIQWLVENGKFGLADRNDLRAVRLFVEGANDLAFRGADFSPPDIEVSAAPFKDAIDIRVSISAKLKQGYDPGTDRFQLVVRGSVLGYFNSNPNQFRVTDKIKPGFTDNLTSSAIGVSTPRGAYHPEHTSRLSLSIPQKAFAPVQYTQYPKVAFKVDGKIVNPFPLPGDDKPDFVQAAIVIRVGRPTILRDTPYSHVGRVTWDPDLATRSLLETPPDLKLSLVFARSLGYSRVSPTLKQNEDSDLYATSLRYQEEGNADFAWQNDDLSYVFAAVNWITGAVLLVLFADFLLTAVKSNDSKDDRT